MKGINMTRRRLTIVVAVAMVSAVLVGAWRPKSKYAYGGIWVGRDPTNPASAIFYTHCSADDMAGYREFSYYINHFNIDATLGGFFPDAMLLADGVGRGHATGKETFEFSSLICAVNSTNFVQYYLVGSGKGVWLNADEQMIEDFTCSVYLPAQDADYDGIPDEGQVPIVCLAIPLHMKRVPYFGQCEPPPA